MERRQGTVLGRRQGTKETGDGSLSPESLAIVRKGDREPSPVSFSILLQLCEKAHKKVIIDKLNMIPL